MKNLVCLLFISLVMLFSCSKDVMTDVNPDLKKAKVPIPMKMEMCAVTGSGVFDFHVENTPATDPSTGNVIVPDLYVASEFLVSGYGTHFGELMEQSSETIQSAYLDLDALSTEHKVVLVFVYELRFFAANGDYCDGISHVRIDRTDPSHRVITGDVEFLNGTGNFEGVTGNCVINGEMPCWHIEGTLEYPR